ncbi:hypothetical protein, partial [Cryptosporangium phraense]|uniref:hypothetical protein n=1 Tax=Cryptosporangium phraense TaxID=2593070 RepID=UPI00197AEA14
MGGSVARAVCLAVVLLCCSGRAAVADDDWSPWGGASEWEVARSGGYDQGRAGGWGETWDVPPPPETRFAPPQWHPLHQAAARQAAQRAAARQAAARQ